MDENDAQIHLLKPEVEFWGDFSEKPTLHHGGNQFVLGKTEIQLLHALSKIGREVPADTVFILATISQLNPRQHYKSKSKAIRFFITKLFKILCIIECMHSNENRPMKPNPRAAVIKL